jgi:hypothetical protein
MAWLDRRGAGAGVRKAAKATLPLRLAFRALGTIGERMRAAQLDTLVGTAVFGELGKQFLSGARMDPEGLRLARQFLTNNPELLPHLQARSATFADPNVREAWNTLLARCQAVNTQPMRKS